jgi:hypothetical protein
MEMAVSKAALVMTDFLRLVGSDPILGVLV